LNFSITSSAKEHQIKKLTERAKAYSKCTVKLQQSNVSAVIETNHNFKRNGKIFKRKQFR